jgi:hypothetical protein
VSEPDSSRTNLAQNNRRYQDVGHATPPGQQPGAEPPLALDAGTAAQRARREQARDVHGELGKHCARCLPLSNCLYLITDPQQVAEGTKEIVFSVQQDVLS